MPHIDDNLTQSGALDLAQRIAKHWLEQGHLVSTWIESFVARGDKRWGVRSGLIDGIPATKPKGDS
jgi:hypothetical protein